MKDIYVLSDLEKVKTISDPLRMEILQLLIKQSLTAKQLADAVKQSSSKIHYHVKELEKQGLIELVNTVEKGGILEKYYRAVADNFYIDQTLGEYFEQKDSNLVDVVTHDILSWRRVNRLKVDIQALAYKIVRTCLGISDGEVVGIIGGTHQMDFIEPLALEIQRAGAYPLLSLSTSLLKHKTIEESSLEKINADFERLSDTLRSVTTIIMLEHVVHPFMAKSLDYHKIEAYRKAWSTVRDNLVKRKVKWAFIGYPTQALADSMNINFIEFHDVFWKSIDVNYGELHDSARYVADVLAKGSKVYLKSNKGTELELSIENRRPYIDDGVVSESDIQNGDTIINLPSGEVYIAPIENSAKGRVYFDLAYYQGEAIEGIELEFIEGEIVKISAQKNEYKLKQLLETGEKGRKILGELGIGLNPWIKRAIGYQVCDMKQLGSMHLALGENRLFGGKNEASIHWPLIMTDVDLWVDDIPVLLNNELMLA